MKKEIKLLSKGFSKKLSKKERVIIAHCVKHLHGLYIGRWGMCYIVGVKK